MVNLLPALPVQPGLETGNCIGLEDRGPFCGSWAQSMCMCVYVYGGRGQGGGGKRKGHTSMLF